MLLPSSDFCLAFSLRITCVITCICLTSSLEIELHLCVSITMVDVTADPHFAGLLQAIDPFGNLWPDHGQILDDIEGEQETIPEDGLNTNDVSDLLQMVTQLSNGVCNKTDQEYRQ